MRESPVPGTSQGRSQDDGAKSPTPPVGTYGDHRHVGQARHRRAEAILFEGLQEKGHRHRFAVLLGKNGEAGRIGEPVGDLFPRLGFTGAGHRAQR